MSSKRVLIFSLVYYPRFIGGAEVAVKEITDRIPDIEFDMITLRKHAPPFERIGNVNVYRVGWPWRDGRTSSSKIFPLSKYAFPFFALLKAWSLHRNRRYHATWSIMANYAGFGALFFKMLNPSVEFILTLQEGDPTDYIKRRVGLLYPLFKKIFMKADKVQAISNFLASWAKDMGYKGRVEVIPNGVDTKMFENPKQSESQAETKTLITTSRLVKKNGVEDVIRSLALLPENYRFKIFGTGPLDSHLKKVAEKIGVAGRVDFAGFIDQKDMPTELHKADIFIRPSLSEGMGNSFIEAMAAGLPVIATEVGGIPDFLFDPDKTPHKPPTGLFVRVGDPKDIARQVARLMKNERLRETLIANGKRLAKEKYDWNLIAETIKKRVFEPSF